MTPLEIAMLLERSRGQISRDPATGLYLIDGGAVALTLAAYEAGMKVLAVREKAAISRAPR